VLHYLSAFIVCILLCVYTVRIKVSHHNKINQDRHYSIYIHTNDRYNKTNVDTIVSILFYFVVVTDLNPYIICQHQEKHYIVLDFLRFNIIPKYTLRKLHNSLKVYCHTHFRTYAK
jgi:hypothetical protein